MPMNDKIIVFRSKEATTMKVRPMLLWVVRGRGHDRGDFWGAGKVAFLDLNSSCKGAHSVIIHGAVPLCLAYFSDSVIFHNRNS